MANNPMKQEDNEEVDLIILLNYFGDRFSALFNNIRKFLKSIFSFLINIAKDVQKNWKLITILMLLAFAVGSVLQHFSKPTYESKLLVRTYFEAKYQLASNLDNYNSLIDNKEYSLLADVFEITEEEMAHVKMFELSRGPESQNQKLLQYEVFINSLDSIRAQDITFEDYLENRNIFSGDIFELRVVSSKRDIFSKLEIGVSKSFENLYSSEKKKKRDSLLILRKENILSTIASIDSLQSVYINVLEEESQSTKANISLGEGFPIQQEKSETKEYQLLNKKVELRNELRLIEEEKVAQNKFYEVISSFQKIGTRVSDPWKKYSFIAPAITLILIIITYLLMKVSKFVKNYEE